MSEVLVLHKGSVMQSPSTQQRNTTCSWRRGYPPGLAGWSCLGIGLVLSLLIGMERRLVAVPAVPECCASALVVGQPAPDFVAQTVHGEPVTLLSYRGRTVVLNFWATWCVPCRHELPALQAAYEVYQEKGVVILAVSQDAAEQHDMVRAYMTTQGLTFPALHDPQGSIAAQYNVMLLPSTIFINPAGTITATHIGPMTRMQIERHLATITASPG